MTNTRDLILKLKEVRNERIKELSYTNIIKKIEATNPFPPSKATLSRLFADGSEDEADSFSYERVLIPVANAILDVDIDEETDTMDTKALKALLKSKKERIKELEAIIEKDKIKYHEKLEKERAHFERSLDFLKHQVDLKDKRIDMLFEAVFLRKDQHNELLSAIKECPYRKDE